MNQQNQLLMNQAAQAFQFGNLERADSILKHCIDINPKNWTAMHFRGLVKLSQGRIEEAVELFIQAVKIHPKDSVLQYNLAKALANCGRFEDAIPHHKKSVELAPTNPDAWLNYGRTLFEIGEYETSLEFFEKTLYLESDYVEGWLNKGNTLYYLHRYKEALISLEQAIQYKPDNSQAYIYKGCCLSKLERYDEALKSLDIAIELQPISSAYLLKGSLLNDLGRIEEAIKFHQIAYSLDKGNVQIYQNTCFAKMCICEWNTLVNDINNLEKIIFDEKNISTPFIFISILDNLMQNQKASEQYAKQISSNITVTNSNILNITNKIRVGYYSADFYNHATGYLMAGLFEQHNRDQFELIAFSFGPRTNDGMRQRLEKAFDQFIEVGNISDKEVAKLSRELDIAIAVDLMGFSGESKTGIFAYRAAPIQVNYLGYPGTMGASYIDYIVADPILIPPEFQDFYTEKVIYLPYSYQVNDRKREISDRKFSRAEVGLPEKGFIFCCFNNNYKILPEIFDIWMRLLQTVDHSVLWLLEDNSAAAKNLKSEAMQRGINPERLVFAQRLPSAEHLARHALADLFIDTFPYNAHTTASDALWAGLPLVTLQGDSFASRVASSLLSAIGLPELITHTHQEYESLAIELAMNPQKLASLKQKLINNRMTTPLFDTNQYTKHLENAYLQMYERYQANLLPENIYVEQEQVKQESKNY